MKTTNSTVINLCAALITFVVQAFISFWLSPFVVSRLGDEAYGFINLAANFVSYASLLSVMVNSMASRHISVEYNSGRLEGAKKYYSTVFIANCILFGIIIIFAVLLVFKLEKVVNISEELVFQVKVSFMLSFINMGVSLLGTVYTSATFATNKMHLSSIVQIVSNVAKSLMIFAFFMIFPARIYLFSAATLIAGIITLGGNYKIAKRLFGDFSISLCLFDYQKLKTLIKSGFWVLISNLSNLLLNGLDLLFSNWFISGAIMGRLSLAKQIPYALSSALGIFSNIFSSSQTKVYTIEGQESLISEAIFQLKILTLLFTVPYAGIIVFGQSFLQLWLRGANYSALQLDEIYIFMILIMLDVITSTYMYSIHSVFIALDKVRVYSVILFIASIVSISLTLFLLKTTNLGAYAISGTSTVVLGVVHGAIVPAMAARLLEKPIWLFWKPELRSWLILIFECMLFFSMSIIFNIESWKSFFASIAIAGIVGYFCSFFLIFTKSEKRAIGRLFKIVKERISAKIQ